MKKTTYLILFILTSLVCNSALSQTTISFDDQGFNACIEISDTHAFSAIGKSFNIYAANFDGTPSANGSLWYDVAEGGCWQSFPTEFEDGGFVTAGYANGQSAQQWYAPEALVIKTTDNSDFKFTSFKAHDAEWNSWGNYLKISGYTDGVLQGSESVVIVSDVEPYHSTVTLTNPVFESVDEVRITMDKDNNPAFGDSGIQQSNAEGLFHSFDTFVIDNAVSSATISTVSTSAASSITATGVTFNGEVTNDGGATVTERGFVYSITDNTPTIGETGVTQVTDGSGTGAFSEAISGLSASTTYYYQAYATNSEGTTYGGVENFDTVVAACAPTVGVTDFEGLYTVITQLATGIGAATATVECFDFTSITVDPSHTARVSGTSVSGNELLIMQGVGTSPNANLARVIIKSNDNSEFSFKSIKVQPFGTFTDWDITYNGYKDGSLVSGANLSRNDMVASTMYTDDFSSISGFSNVDEIRIEFAVVGTSYQNFRIDDIEIGPAISVTQPSLTTDAASAITASGATLNGNVTSDGGATVTARGFVYSNSDNTPAIGEIGVTQVTVGSGIGVFSKAISGLNPSTTYYYRAYATNSAGTTYGGVQSFTTSNPQLVNFSWSADNLSAEATGVTYTFSYEIVTANPYNILYAINNYGWELPFMGLSENNYEITPIEKENVTVKVNGSDRDFNVRNWSSGLLIVRLTDPTVASGSHVEIIIENVTNKSVGTHNWTWIRTSTSGGQEIDGVVSPNSIVLSANTPTVSTAAATSITTNGATVAGNVTSDGGATVFARGFVYSSTDNTPTIGETGVTQVTDGSGTGVFDEGISGLSSSTTYYYRAYATNSAGTTYGGIENFTTLVANTPPLVDANMGLMVSQGTTGNIDSGKLHFNDDETEDDDQLTGTIISAVAHGILFLDVNLNNIFDLGDEELIVNATFTQDNVNNDRLRYTNTIANETSDSFVFKVSDSDGGELSNQTFNITINQIPTVTVNNGLTLDEGTTELIDSGRLNATDAESGGGSDITFTITSAVSHGILFIDSNPSNVFEAGDIELIENATFTLDDINNDKLRYTNTVGNQTTDSFEFKVSDPDGGELTNQTFTITINLLEAPTVTTTAATDVTNTTATLGGEVTNSGSATATEYGIVYNTIGAPTIADTKVQIGSGIGSFAQEITALTAATTYYVRAYAINAVGTSYGSEESFITSTLGLDDSLKNAISLYPNPVNNLLFITNDTKIENIILFDVMGKRIGTLKMDNNVINVSNLETGIYILKIETSNGNVIERIIKR